MIILEANKPQSCTKLFIFGSVSPVLNKACIKPVWAGSSAQLSYTAHKLVPYLQIPVLASISINWLLGFLLHAGGSSPAETCCSSQPPIFFRLCRSSSLHPVKSRLPATSLPLQVLFLAPWCSSLADFAVKLNFFSTFYHVQLSKMSCCWFLSFSSQTPQTEILCLTNEAYKLK